MKLKKSLLHQIRSIIISSRENAIRTVDFERVMMYGNIGKVIFEEEQGGKDRAKYGKFLLKAISEEFLPKSGSDFRFANKN
jgi:hypothetical protein